MNLEKKNKKMAPVKGSKKPPKLMEKPLEKSITKTKRLKKKNYTNFHIYLYKLLRSVTQEKCGITRKSIQIMNNFVYDLLEKIAMEAGTLVNHSKRNTLSSREIQTAVRLLIPGELAKHANMEATKALTLYHNSREKQ